MFCMFLPWVNDYLNQPDGELKRDLSTPAQRMWNFSKAIFNELEQKAGHSIVAFLFRDNSVRLVALNDTDEQLLSTINVTADVVERMISHRIQLSKPLETKDRDNTIPRYGSSRTLSKRATFIRGDVDETPYPRRIAVREVATLELPESYFRTDPKRSTNASMVLFSHATQKQLDEARSTQKNKVNYMLKVALTGASSPVDDVYKSALKKNIESIVKKVDEDLQVGGGVSRWGLFHEREMSFKLVRDNGNSISERRFTNYYTPTEFQYQRDVREVFTCRAYNFFILVGDYNEVHILRYWSSLFDTGGEFYADLGPDIPSRTNDAKGWKSLWKLGTISRPRSKGKRPFSRDGRNAKRRRAKASSSKFFGTSSQLTKAELLYWEFMHSLMDEEHIDAGKISYIYDCAVCIPVVITMSVERRNAICAWWRRTPHTEKSTTTLVQQFHDAAATFGIEFDDQ